MASHQEKPSYLGAAAVLVIVDPRQDAILLTLRSAHMNSHSAEVALPGGKWESHDANLLATALRETEEEVGLQKSDLDVFGELPASFTKAGVRVKPYVAMLCSDAKARVNSEELEAVFWMPEEVVVTDIRLRTDLFELNGHEYWSPAYRYNDYEVWGFTARVLVQYLEQFRQVQLPQTNSAPVARHKPMLRPR